MTGESIPPTLPGHDVCGLRGIIGGCHKRLR